MAEDEYEEFMRALSQVLWDYEPQDQTVLWKEVNKAIMKARKEKANKEKK